MKTFLAHKAYRGTIRYLKDVEEEILTVFLYCRYTGTNTPETCLLTQRCGEGCPTCTVDVDHKENSSIKDIQTVENENSATTIELEGETGLTTTSGDCSGIMSHTDKTEINGK